MPWNSHKSCCCSSNCGCYIRWSRSGRNWEKPSCKSLQCPMSISAIWRDWSAHSKTTARDDRFLGLRIVMVTAVTLRNLLQEVRNVNVSDWTVRRRLHAAGLFSRTRATGPPFLVNTGLHGWILHENSWLGQQRIGVPYCFPKKRHFVLRAQIYV